MPEFKRVENLKVAEAVAHTLDNGTRLFVINAGTQDLVKIELLYHAGTFTEPKRLVAAAVNAMLGDGTQHHTADEIAENIDSYGAFFQTENGSDWCSATLYSLTKFLDKTLPLLKEIVTESVFPEKELETYIQNKIQNLVVNNERVDFIARKKFSEGLFGAQHPYGYYATEQDFKNLKREDLLDFFKSRYTAENSMVIVSGKVTETTLEKINTILGQIPHGNITQPLLTVAAPASLPSGKISIHKPESIQSAIRIGKLMVNKAHPDYIGLQVLNTVLGGYFGSRLMTNIREDKGYTYGIGSAVASNTEAGYFFISTETGTEVVQKALNEIYFELGRLRSELIPEAELSLVRNYMLGTFMRSIDGPFELANKFKGIVTYGLGYEYYDAFIDTVKNISAETLRTLAHIYFQEDTLLELVVGKGNG
jgi:zinc protease